MNQCDCAWQDFAVFRDRLLVSIWEQNQLLNKSVSYSSSTANAAEAGLSMQVAHPRPTPHTRHWDGVTPLVSPQRPVPLCASYHHRHLRCFCRYLARQMPQLFWRPLAPPMWVGSGLFFLQEHYWDIWNVAALEDNPRAPNHHVTSSLLVTSLRSNSWV